MAPTVKVPIARTSPPQFASMERGATVGAVVGVNLHWPDGTLVTAQQLGITPATAADDGNGGNSFTNWEFLQEVPAAVTALAETATTGLYVITGDGSSTTRTLAISDDLTLSNPDGVAGNPMLALADLADSGAGAALAKITRDSKGRISGSSAATTDDLTEGARLYYTDARADARIASHAHFPFFASDGSSSPIAITSDLKLPFFVSGGTASNIPLAA